MESRIIEAEDWSRHRWFWTVLTVFAFHVGLVTFLSNGTPAARPWPSPSLRIQMHPAPAEIDHPLKFQSFRDPTLFALVHPKVFSGSAWLHAPAFPYATASRSAPADWLEPGNAELGDEFAVFLQEQFSGFLPRPEKPLPRVSGVERPGTLTPERAVVRVEGGLASRKMIFQPALPPAEPGLDLGRCVVDVVVDARGETFSPLILVQSRSATADRSALTFANAVRFAPVSAQAAGLPAGSPPFAYGSLVFQWLAARKEPEPLPTKP